MDRASLRGLARTRGYRGFVAAATLARVADEMFSVGVVLLVLDRTDSAVLAGATVAAVTLPSLVTGPLLGAYMDLTGKRRTLMLVDQLLMTASLVAILLLAGNAPDVLLPVAALLGGLTYPLSFGGFSSLISVIVPARLLEPANAIEVSSFNSALVLGPAFAGGLSAAISPAAPVIVQIVLTLAALVLIARIPNLDSPRERDGRSLVGVAVTGLKLIVRSPPLRSITAAGSLGLGGLGLLTVAFPFYAVEHLDTDRGAAGLMWAAFAIGSMAGALGLVCIQRRFEPERIVLVSLAVFGACMLLWPLQTDLVPLLAVIALAGLMDGPGLAATFATRQRHVPSELHGQVFTTAVGLKVGSLALGAAVAGPIVIAVGSDVTLLIAAGMQFVAVAAGVALGARTISPALIS